MGTDIHLFIEYDVSSRAGHWKHSILPPRPEHTVPFSDERYVKSFAEGELLIPRDYMLFAALAGVRKDEGFIPLIPPRGFPAMASSDTINDFFQYVLDVGEDRLEEDNVQRVEAEKWVKEGRAFYRDHTNKPRGYVSNPGWHTPSWLTLAETVGALEHANITLQDMSCEFQTTIVALQSLERFFGADRARIVFWFDN